MEDMMVKEIAMGIVVEDMALEDLVLEAEDSVKLDKMALVEEYLVRVVEVVSVVLGIVDLEEMVKALLTLKEMIIGDSVQEVMVDLVAPCLEMKALVSQMMVLKDKGKEVLEATNMVMVLEIMR
uniref:Uncharacterized protein n=1 Tax=Acrobeloides nanus TaxID=290746 RepID=A0A914CIA7_9BILA